MVAHAFVTGSAPPHTVADSHASILEHRGEAIVELIAPRRTVDDVHAFVSIVLVEALMQIAEGDAVGDYVSSQRLVESRSPTAASATKLEAVAVLTFAAIRQVTCMVSPAGVDDDRMIDHI